MEVAQYLLNGISKLSVNPGLTAADGLGQNSARPRGVQHQQGHFWKCIPRPPWDLLGDKGQLLAAGVLRGAAFPPGCGHTQSQRRLREAAEGPHPRQRDPPPAPELLQGSGCLRRLPSISKVINSCSGSISSCPFPRKAGWSFLGKPPCWRGAACNSVFIHLHAGFGTPQQPPQPLPRVKSLVNTSQRDSGRDRKHILHCTAAAPCISPK